MSVLDRFRASQRSAPAATVVQSSGFEDLFGVLLQNVAVNVIYADDNNIIRFVNKASLDTLGELAHL
ncbi:MAG: hypothetical protein AB7L13_16330 [Acidimicrobiia bacterium]